MFCFLYAVFNPCWYVSSELFMIGEVDRFTKIINKQTNLFFHWLPPLPHPGSLSPGSIYLLLGYFEAYYKQVDKAKKRDD